jgi:hypothetical protein
MRSFEIFVADDPNLTAHSPAAPAEGDIPRSGRRNAQRGAREVLDVFVAGANVTARVGSRHATAALRDLGLAAAELATRTTGKTIVRFYDEPWEMCLERFGDVASLSVYRSGVDPRVTVHDARVTFLEVVDSLIEATDGAIARQTAPEPILADLVRAKEALAHIDRTTVGVLLPPTSVVTIDVDREAPVALGADFVLRTTIHDSENTGPKVERTDLHALLFRGRVRAEARGRAIELGEAYPFVFAERFLELAALALESWESGQERFVRQEGGGIIIGVRVSPTGDVALTLTGSNGASYTFPSLAVVDVAECALGFGRALVRGVLRRDRTQCMNLRLGALRRALRDTESALREVVRDDVMLNSEPEPYRAFAAHARDSAAQNGAFAATTKLRYGQRWRALVPGIDLRSTFLCGDRLVVGALLETFCLDRASGEMIWRVPTVRATSVVTPGGIARLLPDGHLEVHDFGTGEVTLRARIRARLGGPSAGAVVNAPGLPKLLIVTEGERHLVAVDLASGEPRWRYAWGRGGALRLRRHGRLLYVASGDSALTAIDVQSGEVVWRVRSRLRFRSAPVVDHDLLLAVAGGMNSAAELWGIDPFSGEVRFRAAVGQGPATVEGTPVAAGAVAVCALRDRYGLRLAAFERSSGAPSWHTEGAIAPIGTSWLAVDEVVIGNTPTGELMALEAAGGALRYRHVLGSVLESDIPRRLEPVLRSGALFVPHTDVQVFRPSDGARLASIGPCDAIPDLLRVDEKCDVYVAEESGHLVSFAAGPRLTLVK